MARAGMPDAIPIYETIGPSRRARLFAVALTPSLYAAYAAGGRGTNGTELVSERGTFGRRIPGRRHAQHGALIGTASWIAIPGFCASAYSSKHGDMVVLAVLGWVRYRRA